MTKRISQELEAKIVQVYQDGARPYQIAKDLHVSENTVQRVLDRNGITRRGYVQRRMKPSLQKDVCERYAKGESPKLLAKDFGVSVFTIRDIIKSKSGVLNPKGQQYRRFTNEEIELTRLMRDQGFSQTAIAATLGTSQTTISRAMREHGIEPNFIGHHRGEKHGSWKGGVHYNGEYIEVWVDPSDPMAPMCNRQGYTLEHRLVMARSLGRPLTNKETVHHINGDKQDNRPENLQVRTGNHGIGITYTCADCGSHNIIHSALGD